MKPLPYFTSDLERINSRSDYDLFFLVEKECIEAETNLHIFFASSHYKHHMMECVKR